MPRYAIVTSGGVVVDVVVADDTFVAPSGDTAVATDTANIGEIWNGSTFTPEPLPNDIPSLVAYANAKQWALATGGYTKTIGGTPVGFATDPQSLSLMTGAALRMLQPGAPATINWQNGATSFTTIAAGNFTAAATTLADFVEATFNALATVVAGIIGGTITTQAQIDAASWPSNSG